MLNRIFLLLSALALLGVLLPALTVYAIAMAVIVVLVNPAARLYELCRYGIQSPASPEAA